MFSRVGWIDSRVIGSIGSIGGSADTCGAKTGACATTLARDSATVVSTGEGDGDGDVATGSTTGRVSAIVDCAGAVWRCHGWTITIAMMTAAAAAISVHAAYGGRRA